MFLIRTDQIAALQRDADQRLGRFLQAKMMEVWPVQCAVLPADLVSRMCNEAVLDGRRFGLQSDQSIARLLNLRFALGRQFPSGDAEAEAILGNARIAEGERMNILVSRLGQRGSAHAASP